MACNCKKKRRYVLASPSARFETDTKHPESAARHRLPAIPYRARLEICRQCEHVKYFLWRPRCGICGCFMEIKAGIPGMHCPLGKW